MARARPSNAFFEATYAAIRVRGTRTTSDVTNTMSPRSRSTMPGPSARTSLCAPTRFTCTWRANASGSTSSAAAGSTSPALETSTSTGPSALGRRRERVDGSLVREVEREGHRLTAVGLDPGGRLLETVEAAGTQDHRMPGVRQRGSGRGADAPGRARDDGSAALRVRRELRHQPGRPTWTCGSERPDRASRAASCRARCLADEPAAAGDRSGRSVSQDATGGPAGRALIAGSPSSAGPRSRGR